MLSPPAWLLVFVIIWVTVDSLHIFPIATASNIYPPPCSLLLPAVVHTKNNCYEKSKVSWHLTIDGSGSASRRSVSLLATESIGGRRGAREQGGLRVASGGEVLVGELFCLLIHRCLGFGHVGSLLHLLFLNANVTNL